MIVLLSNASIAVLLVFLLTSSSIIMAQSGINSDVNGQAALARCDTTNPFHGRDDIVHSARPTMAENAPNLSELAVHPFAKRSILVQAAILSDLITCSAICGPTRSLLVDSPLVGCR